ncbi:MAG TPA: HAMP domain-containing histidine kinase [Sulfurovum sp.]|nr:HAMP domain-containing histidine kinase [Sulfurovum sp.]
MNELEKKSFYSFLGLYIFSSFLFLLLVGYWYYTAQKNALENEMYYKLQHISDVKSGDIIMAHMSNTKLKKRSVPKDISLVLIDIDGKVREGKLYTNTIPNQAGYFSENGYDVFVSDAPRAHLNIKYVVAQSDTLSRALKELRQTVLRVMVIIAIILFMIAWALSKIFMKPLRQKVEQIERFINDVTHELNTPITSLSMATEQALKQGKYTQKTLKNISISTKQLYDIYSSLTYLNFSNTNEEAEVIDVAKVLQKSIVYYEPLCESKRLKVEVNLESYIFGIPETQLKLLFGNLIGNAIKYSPANTTLRIELKEGIFTIQDEGIGIEEDKQKEIFEKFKRGTEYSGGFGVGLNIVKSICDNYDIKVTLKSVPDKGTMFMLYFK